MPGAADGQPRPVGENGRACLSLALQTGQAIDVEQVGAVDAHEARGVESGRELGQRLLLQVDSCSLLCRPT